MSEIRSHLKVKSIASTALTTAVLGGTALAACIAAAVRSLSTAGKAAYEQISQSPPSVDVMERECLRPVSDLREETHALQTEMQQRIAEHRLPSSEAMKVSTLLTVASTPYQVEDTAVLEQQMEVLRLSTTPNVARRAQQALMETLETSHHQLFMRQLTLACQNAAMQVGFHTVETTTGALGEARIIATDTTGRALVTEIHADAHQAPGLATEVVGVSDGSCHAILDAFDEVLESQGVRATPPERQPTGGVCELAAAREFVRRRVKRPSTQTRPAAARQSDRSAQRRQRFNREQVQR